MRLQQYLTESSRTKTLKEEKFIQMAKNHTDAIKTYVYDDAGMYRGIGTHKSVFGYVEPSKFDRKSANTMNYYTLLIDNMKSWSEFPPRSKSIICSTSYKSASGYGSVFVVLPKNGSTIGVSQNQDFWISFREMKVRNIDDLAEFNQYLNIALAIAHSYKNRTEFSPYTKYDQSYKQVVDLINYFDSIYKENENQIITMAAQNVHDKHIFRRLVEGGLMNNIKEILDPNKNGFYTLKSRELKGLRARDRNEVWTDGDCLLVNIDGSYVSGSNRFYSEEQLKDWFMTTLSI